MRKKISYEEGVILLEETSSTAIKGAISTKSGDEKLHVYLDGADRNLVTENQSQTLSNKSIDADTNPISNLETDNLKSGVLNSSTTLSGATDTQIPSALAVKTYAEDLATSVQDNLDAHIADTSGAHAASAISVTPVGNLTATDGQSAFTELDSDITTVQTNLDNHINDTTDAHDASAISTTPISGVTGTDVQAMLADLKTQIDTKGTGNGDVTGPASSTDNAIVRFDLATGKVIQNSTVTLSDTGVVVGASIDADTNTITNIENADIKSGANIDRTKLASGTNYRILANNFSGVMSENAALTSTRIPYADANGQLTDSSDFLVSANGIVLGTTKHLETQAQTDSSTTGSNASLASFTAGVVRLTNASLASLANIPAGANGQQLIIINRTGVDFNILDSSSAIGTASNRIFTGTNAIISCKNNSALVLTYDSTSSRWQIIGGSGASASSLLIATLSDVKANSTNGGSSSTGFQTRTLNTIVDPNSIVTSLTANQFVLPAGTYYFDGASRAYKANSHVIRLRNITDSTTALIGSGAYTSSTDVVDTHTFLMGQVTIAAPKTFEIQHYVLVSQATTGFGNAVNSGENEVFTILKITKLS